MSKDTSKQPPKKSDAREDALRANLLKRKQQQRGRSQAENTTSPTDKEKK